MPGIVSPCSQHNKREIGPRRLVFGPAKQPAQVVAGKSLLRYDGNAGPGFKPAQELIKTRAGDALQPRILQKRARRSTVPPRRGEHEYPLAIMGTESVLHHVLRAPAGSSGLEPPA